MNVIGGTQLIGRDANSIFNVISNIAIGTNTIHEFRTKPIIVRWTGSGNNY